MNQELDLIIAQFLGIPVSVIQSVNSELQDQLRACAKKEEFMQLHHLGYAIHLQLIQSK